MAKSGIAVIAFIVFVTTQHGQVSSLDLNSMLSDAKEWTMKQINTGLDSAKEYLERFRNESCVYIEIARKKEKEYRKELTEKAAQFVNEFTTRHLNEQGHSQKCVNEVRSEFESEVQETVSKANECILEVINNDDELYNNLVSLAEKDIEKLVYHKEEAFECAKDTKGLSQAWLAVKCLKAVGSAGFVVVEGFLELKLQFIKLSSNLAISPIRQGLCLGSKIYDIVKSQMKNAESRLEQCAQSHEESSTLAYY